MKKILAIVCAMAVFVSALAGTFIFSGANTTDEEYPTALVGSLSEIVDGGGSYSSSFALIDSLTPLNSKQSVSVTPVARYIANGADSAANKVVVYNYAEAFAMKDVEGYMMYVDVSANTTKNVNFLLKNFTALNAGSGGNAGIYGWTSIAKNAGETPTVYLLADDGEEGTTWTAQALPTDKEDTSANPFANKNGNYGVNLPVGFKGYIYIPTDCYHVNTINIQSIAVFMSSPVNLPDAKYYVSAPMMVTGFDADKTTFVGDDATVNLDTNKAFVEEAPPSYDYSEYNLMNVTVTEVNGEVKVGEPIPTTALSGPTEGANMEAVASVLAITKYPSFKISTGELTSVNYQFDLNEATATGGKHVMTYVELPEGKSATLKTGWNVHKDGKAGYGSQYGSQVYILQEGDVDWTPLTVTAYNYELPAGFKGYVRYNLSKLNLAGALSGTTVDETYSIYQANYTFSAFEAGIDIYVSAPIMVEDISDEFDYIDIAFVNGDTTQAKNIFTGEVLVPPVSYDYSDYKIMNTTLLKPKTPVVIGADNSAILRASSGSTVEVVEGKLGAFNYPSVKLTRGDAAGEVKLSYYGEADGDTTKGNGATAVLLYVELPEGDTASIAAGLNFWKDDGTSDRYFTNSYGDTFYYMAEGTDTWNSVKADGYNAALPAGFKGIIRYDYSQLGGPDATSRLYEINFYLRDIAAGKSAYMSFPFSVPEYTEEYENWYVFADGYTKTANHIITGEALVPEASYDYSDYKIMEATVVKPKVPVTVGGDATTALRPAAGSTVEVIDGILGGIDYPSFKITRGDSDGEAHLCYYTEADVDTTKGKGGNSIFVYLELPEGVTATIATSLNFWKDNGTTERFFSNSHSKTFHLLANGSDTWTTTKASGYNAALPAGFKGLIRFDYEQLAGPDETCRLYDVYFYVRSLAANSTIYMSVPFYVPEFTDEYENWYAFVEGATKTANHLLTGEVLVPEEGGPGSGEEPGPGGEGGGETPDPGPGGGEEPGPGGEEPGPTRPTEEPDYNLPAYDGTPVDYDGYRISNVWVGRYNEKVFVGYPFVNESDTCGVEGGTYEVIESIAPITKYPSMKVTATAASATVKHYLDASKSKGAIAAIYYVEAPADKAIRVSFRVNAHKAEGGNAYGSNYSRAIYVMTEDNKVWTKTTTTAYYATLPAGFKGYVRQDYKDLNQFDALADVSTVSAYYTSLIVTDLAAGDAFSISAPIFIDTLSTEHVVNAAYVAGDTGCAREFFTGEFVKPGDKDLGGKTVEPDYKIPAYTGTAIEYGDIDIMHVRTAKLKGSIIVGNALSPDIYVPGYGTGSATESLVGISNYPMFKVSDADVPVGISKNTTYTANYDYKENLGATSIMFYVKLPADSDADFAWSSYWRNKDGSRTTGAYNYSGIFYTMAKGETKWSYQTITKYWHTLPKGFEGYIRIDLKDINTVYAYDDQGRIDYKRDEEGNLILDADNKPIKNPDGNYNHLNGDWGIEAVYAGFSRASEDQLVNVIFSSPILIDEFIPLQTITNIAYVDGDTKAARNIFTGEVVKLGDFDETAGAEPNYWIPHHTGAAENYDKCVIMSTKNLKLADAVLLKEPFSTRALTLGAGTSAKPVKGIHPLSNYPAVEITNSGNVEQNQVNMLFTPSDSAGGEHVMFYVKAPENADTAIRWSWSWTNTRNPKMVTGAYNYSGQAYLMSKDGREWEMVNIDKYFIAIPAGFEGYVRMEIAKIYCVYPYDENDNVIYKKDENGKPILNEAGNAYIVDSNADHYSLAKNPKEWGLNTVYFMWKGIPNGESATVSVPILAYDFDDTTTSPWATFHNDEKFARDVFTGAVLKRIDIIKPTAVGDILKKMPDATTELKAKLADKSQLGNGKATVSWGEVDGASSYTVRVFVTQSGATGLVYKCVGVFDATGTSVEVTGLEANKRYTAVVYAYDASGNEVAIFDYIQINTVGAKPSKDEKPKKDNAVIGATEEEPVEEGGMNIVVLIAIIAGGVLLLAAAAIVTIIVIKKRKVKKA